ncbi:hypothetical protein [Aeoliella mucimassa]|uniref:Uncharacterized protein n=1 Tax=Aeoliella mucimassa TaxID=2527972 RepID=A0A518AJC7_9BACT|nr:hypothetical protein [Aeoliella mucimassa]QDU54837.1 hypothetical protein Pan181_10200 [Aeoliella mucimassa]
MYSAHELERQILAYPLDDSLRIQLEKHLRVTEPQGIDLELLSRERLMAESLEQGSSIDEQLHEYR